MATVRNKALAKTEYKGRPTEAANHLCPCRPCWHPHDCGYSRRVYKYGKWVENEWVMRMECATRFNGGCPRPVPEPQHEFKTPRTKRCMHCGASRRERGDDS